MKNIILIVIISLFSTLVYCQKATDNFAGKWKTDKGIIVEIIKKGNVFVGTSSNAVIILNNLQFVDGEWKGTLIKPEDKSKYNCTAILEGNKLKLTVKKGIISKQITWTK